MQSSTDANAPPSDASLIAAMQLAWSDHQHARNQTWNTVTTVMALAVGLVAVDQKLTSPTATLCASLPVWFMAVLGIVVARRHRKYQRRKFAHIMNCEAALLLRQMGSNYISTGGVLHFPDDPETLPTLSYFRPNTVLYIMLMHAAVIVFTVVIVVFRMLA